MELIINTNRLIAALVKNGESRRIIQSGRFSLNTVEFGLKEMEKHMQEVQSKAKISNQEFNFIMNSLLSKIAVFSEKEISEKSIKEALRIMKAIDENDVPFIALSLELEQSIWSDDLHFKKQKEIRVFTTKELAKML